MQVIKRIIKTNDVKKLEIGYVESFGVDGNNAG